jgi:hypothetical protein
LGAISKQEVRSQSVRDQRTKDSKKPEVGASEQQSHIRLRVRLRRAKEDGVIQAGEQRKKYPVDEAKGSAKKLNETPRQNGSRGALSRHGTWGRKEK